MANYIDCKMLKKVYRVLANKTDIGPIIIKADKSCFKMILQGFDFPIQVSIFRCKNLLNSIFGFYIRKAVQYKN